MMRAPKIRTFSSNEQLVEERRRHIVRCAQQLFIKKGFDRTTMREIGKACRMTSAGIYHYVGKKDDILSLVVQDLYDHLYDFIQEAETFAAQPDPAAGLARAMELYYTMLDNHREDAIFISNNIALFKPALRQQVWETVANVVSVFEKIIKACTRVSTAKTTDSRLLAFNAVALGQMWSLRRDYLAASYTLDDYIKFQTSQIFLQIGISK